MIKYRLRCRCQHEFEGWFPDSKEYKRQKNKGMIHCPMCDSTAVDKAIMAPNVRTSKLKIPEEDHAVRGETAEALSRKSTKRLKQDTKNDTYNME